MMKLSPAVLIFTILAAVVIAGAGAISAVNAHAAAAESPLDRAFAAYQAGGSDVIARQVTRSQDFQVLQVADRGRLDDWLGAWQRPKAMFLLELIEASTRVSPAYTKLMAPAGQLYVMNRRGAQTMTADDAMFARLWHQSALGLLQRRYLTEAADAYTDILLVLARTAPASGLVTSRVVLARAITLEQRCWMSRPDLRRTGAVADGVTRASGTPAIRGNESSSEISKDVARHQACLRDVVDRFTAAAADPETNAEARVRGAWGLLELGRIHEARQMIDGVEPGDDRELAYWAALFRARVATALGRLPDAERGYRSALQLFPEAQSAGIGLALVLFGMDRTLEADTVATSVRARSAAATDPWLTYNAADDRFVPQWMSVLRRGAR